MKKKRMLDSATGLHDIARRYLVARCAARDAKALIDLGLNQALGDKRERLVAVREDPRATLEQVVIVVAAKEALDLIELFETGSEGDGTEAGRTATTAFAASLACARSRYRRGRCTLCKGPALPCARRHAAGMSCA